MEEFHKKYPLASFGFVASNLETEDSTNNTKRFRVYSEMTKRYIGDENFEHRKYEENSAYLIVPRRKLQICPSIISVYEGMFATHSFIDDISDSF